MSKTGCRYVLQTLLPTRDLLIGANYASDRQFDDHGANNTSAQQPDLSVEDRTVDKSTLLTLARLCVDLVNGNHQEREIQLIVENGDKDKFIENANTNREKKVLSENMGYVIERLENHAFVEQMSGENLKHSYDMVDGELKFNEFTTLIADEVVNSVTSKDLTDKTSNKKRKFQDMITYFEASKKCENAKWKKEIRNVSDKLQVPIKKDIETCDINVTGKNKSSEMLDDLIFNKVNMSLYLEKNLNEEMKLETAAHNRLVTIACLSGFLLTVIILTLFPLPG